MSLSIYNFSNYKTFLNAAVDLAGRGERRRLAVAIQSQVSHVTNVLSGSGHLSQEQAEACGRYFGLGHTELEYLLLMLNENRAGTLTLRNFYGQQMKQHRERFLRLQSSLNIQETLSEQQQAKYYSAWYYGAVHVLLSIPKFRSIQVISERLSLARPVVEQVIEFLTCAGLCARVNGVYKQLRPVLHLDRESVHVSRHHTNWRLKAALASEQASPDALHYSGVVSLSKEDFLKIRSVLTEALARSIDIVKASPEEEVAGINIDLFSL